MTPNPLRMLVVDDSTLFRKVIRKLLSEMPNVEVVGEAVDGCDALTKIEELKPDLLTLDIEMPEKDGLGVLRDLSEAGSEVGAIMLSGVTESAIHLTHRCLELGAFDFILKPNFGTAAENFDNLRTELAPRIEAFAAAQNRTESGVKTIPMWNDRAINNVKMISIAISTGGPAALREMLPKLPKDFPAALTVVQHMPPMFTKTLANDLSRVCEIGVVEASDGLTVENGMVYIAPGGKQMKVERSADGCCVRVNDDPPVAKCRPSADYLFRSVADVYGEQLLGVVMTGMGEDGLQGAHAIRQKGGAIFAQDESSCVVYGMARCIIDANLADAIYSLDQLPQALTEATQESIPCR